MHSLLKSIHSESTKLDSTPDVGDMTSQQVYAEQLEKEESKVPQRNLFRDGSMNDYVKDTTYYSGKAVKLDPRTRLVPDDFREEFPGFSAAVNHMKAAELKLDADSTERYEVSHQDTINNIIKSMVLRPETLMGVTYLQNILQRLEDPNGVDVALVMRHLYMLALNWDGELRNILTEIGDKKYEWLRDIVAMTHAILNELHDVNEIVAAINVTLVKLAVAVSTKVAGGIPSASRATRTMSLFGRIIVELLRNAMSIGTVRRNNRPSMRVSLADQVGMTDSQYLSSLKNILEANTDDGY
ncbi:p52K [Frog adenovirus 1]|uniref:p52K n=1 Tax=Frog adenovirus 1 (strain ATCC VR-896) TaxID=114102 RepID=Q9III1_ADEF1|nr:p52K [Frog adenovirus 1]AAF86926.1 p52K [Frog adenovirus 1]